MELNEYLEKHFNHTVDNYEFTVDEMNELITLIKGDKASKAFTEKGIKILECMKENNEKYLNIFNSKTLGELLFMTPRSVSGSMKKLISDGYVEKVGTNPVSYGLTDEGKNIEFDKR